MSNLQSVSSQTGQSVARFTRNVMGNWDKIIVAECNFQIMSSGINHSTHCPDIIYSCDGVTLVVDGNRIWFMCTLLHCCTL